MSIPDYLMGYVISVDTETAVLGDHVCEIGVSIFKAGKVDREWGTFVKPTIPIDPKASAVHNILEKDVEKSPSFAEVAWFIHGILSSADVHIAYNYQYDRGVLANEFARLGMQFPVKPMLDPLIYFRKYHKFNKGKKLVDCTAALGIPYVGAHRAINDATVAGKAMFTMAATHMDFPKSLKLLIQKQRETLEYQHNDFSSYMKRVGRDLPTPPTYEFYEL
jgi:DNA polymerase III epsilon subunit-like protein